MNWPRAAVRTAILAAVVGAVALFFAIGLRPRPSGAPPASPPPPAALR